MKARRGFSRWTVGGTLVVCAGALLAMPVSTRQGVDYAVTVQRLPLYVKAFRFIDRDREYRRLTGEALQGAVSETDRVLALYRWTRAHVRPVPEGFPIIDDHILHIVIRGYGQPDQAADVFSMLSTYAGLPAFWRRVRMQPKDPGVVLSFVRLADGWMVFDVAQGLAFVDQRGRPVPLEVLLRQPALINAVAAGRLPNGFSYRSYLERAQPVKPPPVLRAQMQMPWPRLAYEVKRALRPVPVEPADSEGAITEGFYDDTHRT